MEDCDRKASRGCLRRTRFSGLYSLWRPKRAPVAPGFAIPKHGDSVLSCLFSILADSFGAGGVLIPRTLISDNYQSDETGGGDRVI